MTSISHPSAAVGASRSSVVTGLVWLVTIAAALVTALMTAADRFWPGDMITFFRPLLALAILLLLGAVLLLRRWTASAVLAAVVVINALPLFVIGVPTVASAGSP